MPNIIDLYAGAGGMSLGASRAGFNVVIALEIDKNAIKTHEVNFPNTVHLCCDIRSVTGSQILANSGYDMNSIDGIIGGPPCQGFSTIGHGDVDDERNSLFIRFFQIVSELQPLFFVAENVPGIMKKKYDSIREKAFKLVDNYNIMPALRIDASEYGAATNRTRYFFIGFRNDSGIEMSPEDFTALKIQEADRTKVREALEGLPTNLRYNNTQTGKRRLNDNYFKKTNRNQTEFFFNHVTDIIPEGVGDNAFISRYRKEHETNGFLVTKHSVEVKNRFKKLGFGEIDKVSKSKKLDPNDYCPTLRAGTGPDKGSYQAVRPIHHEVARVINPREAARLQGFPDWYKLPDTIWHSFRQIGNSVSPIAAEAIMRAIIMKLP